MTRAPLLSISELSVSFPTSTGPVSAVQGVDLDIARGEIVGLIGETGSGKSVLGMAILRLLPDVAKVSGRIRFAGADLNVLGSKDMGRLRGGQIGLIPQNPDASLNPALSVGGQLVEVLARHRAFPGPECAVQAQQLLDHMGLSDVDRIGRRYPHQLSGGMKQRVLAAIGIAGQPSLLIADEPTKGLDAIMRGQVIETLDRALRETNAAMLLITHDLDVARELCGRTAVMQSGRIVECQPTAALFDAPQHSYTRKLIDAHPSRLARRLSPAPPSNRVRVEARNVSKAFASRRLFGRALPAVRDVSLRVDAGETLAVIGASGCGKSTLGRLLLGLLRADSGTVLLDDVDTASVSRVRRGALRRKMQILFQHPYAAFDPRFSLRASLVEPLLLHRRATAREAHRKVDALTVGFGMPADILDRYPHQVSGGQLQRLGLARVLTLEPDVLVLDEPTSMLDVSVQAQVLELLQAVQRERGISYLFITHDLDVACAVAHRIAVMDQGMIVDVGDPDHIRRAPSHPCTARLVEAFAYRRRGAAYETA